MRYCSCLSSLVVLHIVLIFSTLKYVLLTQKISNLYFKCTGTASYPIICTVDKLLHILIQLLTWNIWFRSGTVLHHLSATPIFSSYLLPCILHFSRFIPTFLVILSKLSLSFFQFTVRFPFYHLHFHLLFLLHQISPLCAEYVSPEILWNPPCYVWWQSKRYSRSPPEFWRQLSRRNVFWGVWIKPWIRSASSVTLMRHTVASL